MLRLRSKGTNVCEYDDRGICMHIMQWLTVSLPFSRTYENIDCVCICMYVLLLYTLKKVLRSVLTSKIHCETDSLLILMIIICSFVLVSLNQYIYTINFSSVLFRAGSSTIDGESLGWVGGLWLWVIVVWLFWTYAGIIEKSNIPACETS